ncbi:MAG TPA: hypothetical protein VGI76_02615 [Solirubrobacteraceae bacterium]|jgi:hypothetical protein
MSHSHPEDTQADPQPPALAHMRALESVRAPDALRSSIAQMTDEAAARPQRRLAPGVPNWHPLRLRLAGAGALAAAAVAVLAIVLGSGGTSSPTVLQASRVALAPAELASPAENPRDRSKLESSVEGLSYPYWGGRRGWPAAGARRDRLDGRTVTTVFYVAHSGARVGYTIVAGHPLPEPSTGTVIERGGVRFRVLSSAGATILTWRESGHTCILAGRGVPARAMVRLVLS